MTFNGYPLETLTFFTELAANNSKSWLEVHRNDYEAYVMESSGEFVIAIGDRLRELAQT
jgi:uncharacterized protein (DUF2461 family)